MNQLDLKLEYLGYNPLKGNIKLGENYYPLILTLADLCEKDLGKMPTITLEEMKKVAVNFYAKYFDVHDIKFASADTAEGVMSTIKNKSDKIEVLTTYKKYYEMLKEISPFEIPITLVGGHSMVGETQKPIMLIPKKDIPEDVGVMVPFCNIDLGNEITTLSSSTYIHEIAHTQQESNPGYAENYFNKEVISIFLEKLSSYENDLTGEMLKTSERRRFMHISKLMPRLILNEVWGVETPELAKVESMAYIQSTLLAEKMFDMYLQERKQKKKDKYIYDIQNVFDGKQTVEEILGKREITIAKGKDLSLIKRHI